MVIIIDEEKENANNMTYSISYCIKNGNLGGCVEVSPPRDNVDFAPCCGNEVPE